MIHNPHKYRGGLLLWIGCIWLFAGCHSRSTKPAASEMAGWKTVVADDKSYSFSMPGSSTKKIDAFEAFVSTGYTFKQGKLTIALYCTEYSPDYAKGMSAEQALQQAVDRLHKHKGATFLSEKAVTLDGYPGRDMVFNIEKNSMRICQRIFEVKNRTYAMDVTYPQAQDYSKEAAQFLDSLKLN